MGPRSLHINMVFRTPDILPPFNSMNHHPSTPTFFSFPQKQDPKGFIVCLGGFFTTHLKKYVQPQNWIIIFPNVSGWKYTKKYLKPPPPIGPIVAVNHGGGGIPDMLCRMLAWNSSKDLGLGCFSARNVWWPPPVWDGLEKRNVRGLVAISEGDDFFLGFFWCNVKNQKRKPQGLTWVILLFSSKGSWGPSFMGFWNNPHITGRVFQGLPYSPETTLKKIGENPNHH